MKNKPESEGRTDRPLTQNDILTYMYMLEDELYQTRLLVSTIGATLSEQLNRIEELL